MSAPERRTEKGLTRQHIALTFAALVCVSMLLLGIRSIGGQGSGYLRPLLGYTNPTVLHYHVYVIRHAEMKYQPIHKCSPPQVPMLSAQIGYCKDWGDNRCGGDYLVEAGHVRTRCIVETVPFDGLAMIYTQNPGTCDDPIPKVKREYQTVLPIAQSYNVPIDTRFERDEEADAVYDLIHNVTVRNKLCSMPGQVGSALMCWNHENLPLLLQALGCSQRPLCTEPLDQTNYDMVYKVRLDCSDGSFLGIIQYHQNCNVKVNTAISG